MSRTFWIGVGAAVVLVAAMGVGFFINPLIAMAAVPVGGAAAGWLAGRNGTFRGFGGGLLALFGLALVFAVCVLSDPRAVLEAVASDEQRMLVSQFVDSIPPSFAAVAIGLTTIIALELFLCVFNSAILFKRWYFVVAAAVILWAEAAYLGMWLFYAFGAVFAAVTESSLFFGLTALFVLLPVLLTVWAVWNLRAAKQRNWRNFAWCAGGFAVGTFLVWGVAALSIFLYSGSLVERTAKSADPRQPLPRELVERERELRAATIRDFTALHERGIALPYSGMLRWRGAKGKTATAEAKRKTIDFAASEEGKAFFARNRELIDLYCRIAAEGEFVPEISLAHLQGYRAAVRYCADQAALAHCRKDPAAVLASFDPAEKLEQTLYDHEATIIEGLVRIALTSIRLGTIVGCGPEAPEYAVQYRALLKRHLAHEAKIPCEAGFIRGELVRIRRFGRGRFTYPKNIGTYARVLSYPTACAALVYKFRQAEAEEKLAHMWRQYGTVKPADGISMRRAMRRALESRAAYATALALKAYRCEKGEYPKTLDALVPEYLDKVPCDPLTGGDPRYRKFPKGGFMLSFPSNRSLRITPFPRY